MSDNTKVAGKALTYLGGLVFFVPLLGLRDVLAADTHAHLGLLGALFVVSFALMVGGSRLTWGSWRGATLELHWLTAFSAVVLCSLDVIHFAQGVRVPWSVTRARGGLLSQPSIALDLVCVGLVLSMWCRSHPGPWRSVMGWIGFGRARSVLPVVDDQRVHTRTIPAVKVIERALPAFPARIVQGVRKIVLADSDPYATKIDRGAFARYLPPRDSLQAQIQIYFHSLKTTPDDLTHSRPYLTWVLVNAIGHELFHHELIAGKRRRPKFSIEQAAADSRGEQLAALVVRRLFNPLRLDIEWDRAGRRLAEIGAGTPFAPVKHR